MSFNPQLLRNDFPILNNKKFIYFDNACTTLRPQKVIEKGNQYYFEHPSCHNRAVHAFGKETTREVELARDLAKNFINALYSSEIVFTRNATESLNIVAHGLDLKKDDVIVTTSLEHNSNLIPWKEIANKKGIIHKVFNINPSDEKFDLNAFKNFIHSEKVKLVSLIHVSHVTGMILPIKEIIQICHENQAKVLIDAAQSISLLKIDVQELDIDFLVFSLHKMFGPSGMGILYAKKSELQKLNPLYLGGETVSDSYYDKYTLAEIPYRFEAGLQNYSGILAAGEAFQYVGELKKQSIFDHEVKLNQIITDNLRKNTKVVILGPQNPELRPSIVNFYIKEKDMGEISILLDKTKSIMVRSGVHCCHAWYHHHQLKPSLRLSLAPYNTIEEAELFNQTINGIIQFL